MPQQERTVSQVSRSLIDSTVFRGFSAPSQLLLPCVYWCFLVSQSPAQPAQEQDDKKRSTFQRALARVSRVSSLHSGLAGCFICLPCPALPCHQPRNANVHAKPQQGPRSCRATLFPCPTFYTYIYYYCLYVSTACGMHPPPSPKTPTPRSAGVSGCANRSGLPHSKLLVVPVVPVVPLSCHPTFILARHRHGPIPNHQKTLRRAGGKGGE